MNLAMLLSMLSLLALVLVERDVPVSKRSSGCGRRKGMVRLFYSAPASFPRLRLSLDSHSCRSVYLIYHTVVDARSDRITLKSYRLLPPAALRARNVSAPLGVGTSAFT